MIDHAHDLEAIFYGADFASPFTRRRPAADDVVVMAIVGTVDAEALDARAMAASRVARFVGSQDVRADDLLIDDTSGEVFRVLDTPRRVNDGLEVEALLGSASL